MIKSEKVMKFFVILVVLLFMNFTISTSSFAQVGATSTSSVTSTNPAEAGFDATMPTKGNVTVNFKDVDILTVLHYLSEVSGVDIIPSPGVKANVTMRLRDKPWEVALDIVTRNYGYIYSREGDIIRVIPKSQLNAEEPVTEVIPLNHIIRDIELIKQTGESSNGEDVKVQETEKSLQQVMAAINSILDRRRGESATFVSSANAIVVTAIPARISSIKDMIKQIDKKTPQILLDAKVIEITLSEDERMGIDWNTVITAAGARRPITFPFTTEGLLSFLPNEQRDYLSVKGTAAGPTTLASGQQGFPLFDAASLVDPDAAPVSDSLFSYGTLDFSTFQATLSLLDQRGDTEILSCPRVTTLNNQKATIKVVEKIMLQKTQETTQTAGIVTVEFEEEDEAREVGVKLTIMPHVNADDEITVNLVPEVSTNAGFTELNVNGTDNTVSLSFNSREANTRVRVKDGDTIFIGGLIRDNIVKTDNKFPILGDLFGGIPVLGNAFRYEANDVTKTEIVFFVTVHLLDESGESIAESQTVNYYNKYNVVEKQEREQRDIESTQTLIKTGQLKASESMVELPVRKIEAEKPKSKNKPFLDFRKKK